MKFEYQEKEIVNRSINAAENQAFASYDSIAAPALGKGLFCLGQITR